MSEPNVETKIRLLFEPLANICRKAPNYGVLNLYLLGESPDRSIPADFEMQLITLVDFCWQDPEVSTTKGIKTQILALQSECYELYKLQPLTTADDPVLKDKLLLHYGRIIEFYLQSHNLSSVAKYVDAIYKLSNKSDTPDSRWKTLNYLARYNSMTDNYDKAYLLHQEALAAAEESENTEYIKKSLLNAAAAAIEKYAYDKAAEYFNRLLKLLSPHNPVDDNLYMITFNNIGELHLRQGQLDNALTFFEKKIALAQKTDNKHRICGCYSDIGEIYQKKGFLNKARNFYLRDLHLSLEVDNKFEPARALGNLGGIYFLQNKFAEAEEYFLKSCKQAKELSCNGLYHSGVIYLANIAVKKGMYDKALNYLLEQLHACEKRKMLAEVLQVSRNLISVYLENNKPEEAESTIIKAWKQAKSIQNGDFIIKLLFDKCDLAFYNKSCGMVDVFIRQIEDALEKTPNKQFAAQMEYYRTRYLHCKGDYVAAIKNVKIAESKAIDIGLEDLIFEIRVYGSQIRKEMASTIEELKNEENYLLKLLQCHTKEQCAIIYYNLFKTEERVVELDCNTDLSERDSYHRSAVKAYLALAKSMPTTHVRERLLELKNKVSKAH